MLILDVAFAVIVISGIPGQLVGLLSLRMCTVTSLFCDSYSGISNKVAKSTLHLEHAILSTAFNCCNVECYLVDIIRDIYVLSRNLHN